MLFWIIPLGYIAFSFMLIPFMVHSKLDDHKQFKCTIGICKVNPYSTGDTPEEEEERIRIQRKCSADYVFDRSYVLPFMLLNRIPRAIAFGTINRMFAKDERLAKLELEAKAREVELAKARELEAKRTQNDMRDFDKLMKMVENGTVKVKV